MWLGAVQFFHFLNKFVFTVSFKDTLWDFDETLQQIMYLLEMN